MKEWVSEHKITIVLAFFAFIVLTILLLFFTNNNSDNGNNDSQILDKNEMPVITCKNSNTMGNVNIGISIDIYDRSAERLVVQTTNMSVTKKELEDSLLVVFESAVEQQKTLIAEEFGENFQYIKIETLDSNQEKILKTYYFYNQDNYNEMFSIFNLNIHSSTYKEIMEYFESGGLECSKN